MLYNVIEVIIMAGKGKTHQRIIFILNYLREYTKPGAPIDIKNLQSYLDECLEEENSTTRQIIYNDFRELEEAGIGIRHDKNRHYYFEGQEFTRNELSLLVDVICACSYIDMKSAEALINHIKLLTDNESFEELGKDTNISLMNKTPNTECMHNIHILHEAIRKGKKIQFSYSRYNHYGNLYYYTHDDEGDCSKLISIKSNPQNIYEYTREEIILDKDFSVLPHEISPYSVVWDNSQCYLIGGMGNTKKSVEIRVFRVDKIFDLKILENNSVMNERSTFYDNRTGSFNSKKFITSIFDMFSSPENKLTKIEFCVHNKLCGMIFDKFGNDIKLKKADEKHFTFSANIQLSNMFWGWLARFKPDDMRITSPEEVKNEYKEYLKEIAEEY